MCWGLAPIPYSRHGPGFCIAAQCFCWSPVAPAPTQTVSVSPFLPCHFGFSAMPTVAKPSQSSLTFRPQWVSWISKLWLLCRGFTEDLPVISKILFPDHNQISVFYWSFSTHNCKIGSSDLDNLQIPLWFHFVSVKKFALICIIFVSSVALLGFLQQDFKIILLFPS